MYYYFRAAQIHAPRGFRHHRRRGIIPDFSCIRFHIRLGSRSSNAGDSHEYCGTTWRVFAEIGTVRLIAGKSHFLLRFSSPRICHHCRESILIIIHLLGQAPVGSWLHRTTARVRGRACALWEAKTSQVLNSMHPVVPWVPARIDAVWEG
jgi:hypothetical protein